MITIGLFEVIEISWQVLVINLIELLNHGLKTQIVTHERERSISQIITYVKNEWSINVTLKYIVICETLGLEETFQANSF
jgi:hypothetical protein